MNHFLAYMFIFCTALSVGSTSFAETDREKYSMNLWKGDLFISAVHSDNLLKLSVTNNTSGNVKINTPESSNSILLYEIFEKGEVSDLPLNIREFGTIDRMPKIELNPLQTKTFQLKKAVSAKKSYLIELFTQSAPNLKSSKCISLAK